MKRVYSLVRLFFFYIFDSLVSIWSCQRVRRGLVLIRLDAIGDFIIWLDSAKEYRRLYPDKKITVFLNSLLLELAEGLPYWDEVIPVDVKRFGFNPWYRIKMLGYIRRSAFEIAIQPTFSRVFSIGDAFIRASCASQRIGSAGDASNISGLAKSIADRWYTKLVPASTAPMMELERNAQFIGNLNGKEFAANLPVLPKLKPLPDRLQIVGRYFIVFPGASWSGRQWPESHFVEVLTELNFQHGWSPVICGGVGESALCRSIVDASPECTINLSGKTSLLELSELIRGAEILIGNESSGIHIATAVATPSVCILGGGHYGRFLPYPHNIRGIKPLPVNYEMPCYNCNWQCTQRFEEGDAVPCVSGVTVADVMQSVSMWRIGSGRNSLETVAKSLKISRDVRG